jgi:biotin carboxyl carrier protein
MRHISDDDIRWLLQLLEDEDLAEIEVESPGGAVILKAATATATPLHGGPPIVSAQVPADASADSPLPEHLYPLLAPIAGTFFRASSPDAKPFVGVDDIVSVGDTVGLVEAMKLYHDVTSPLRGRIAQILVENQSQVEAEQPLMLIDRRG